MKILIVDDSEDAIIILAKTLEHEGYQVETASHGKEAFAMAMASLPDMIISDILMPEMDGFQFCSKIKSHPTLKKIPFIFHTATYLDPKDEGLGLSLGASRYIVKPVETLNFLKMIHEVIQEYKKGELAIPEKPEADKTALFLMYEESISKKLQEKVEELGLYKNIFTHSKDAIAIIDPKGHYIEQNPAHRLLIKYNSKGKRPQSTWEKDWVVGYSYNPFFVFVTCGPIFRADRKWFEINFLWLSTHRFELFL